MQLSKKLQNQESQLEVVAREKEKALLEKATVQESMDLLRAKLKTQLALINKLVDFTRGVKTRHNNKKLEKWTTIVEEILSKNAKEMA